MSKSKRPKIQVTDICRGSDNPNPPAIIRIVEPIKGLDKNSTSEDWDAFADEQGKKLSIALINALPSTTVVSLIRNLYEIIERSYENTKQSGVKEES